MSVDIPLVTNSPPPFTIMSPPPPSSSNSSVTSLVHAADAPQHPDVDQQILEALSSKDRIYVLKLGEQMEGLINDRTQTRQRLDLLPATTYQRMLVHRCAAYYCLSPETDSLTKVIGVMITPESRIPARRIADLSPPPIETLPKFKIMMRNPRSQASSVTGDDGDVSDVEASETGSLGGRSSASASKHRMTIEERTAAYNEARSRIFVDFEEKDQKETTSSASSSTSLVSGSSASDDPGSPATESEWSGPSAAKKLPPHRANSSSSSRSLRSSAPAFMSSNSSSSSRNSRAPSPAFKYPTLYEPPPQGGVSIAVPPYDPTHAHAHSAPNFHVATPQQQQQQMQQFYPYTAHPHLPPSQQPYMAPYPYYQPYPYSHPPTPGSDPEIYAYNPYNWGPSYPQNGSPPNQNSNHGHPQNHTTNGSPPSMQPYVGYMPPHGTTPPSGYSGYDATPTSASPPNGIPYGQPYYPPPPHHIPMPPYMAPAPPPAQSFEPRVNGRGTNVNGRGRNVNGSGGGGKGRGGVPPQRSAWSYGPGVSGGSGGVDFPSTGAPGYPPLMRDAVGPRLSGAVGMGMRRGSLGNRTTSGSGSSAGDDVASVASSSTSSSSRRTYTSTTSSTQHHPLPPRPDWAVGLRPNPTLHTPRHRDDSHTNSRTISPISPPRITNGTSGHSSNNNSGNSSPHALSAGSIRQQDHTQSPLIAAPAPPALTDFPPLSTSAPVPEKPRAPTVAGGAWTNTSSTRSIVMMPGAVQAQAGGSGGGSALVTHHSGEKGAEGPGAHTKIALVRRPTTGRSDGPGAGIGGAAGKEKERARGDAVACAILVGHVAGMALEERGLADAPAAPAGGAAMPLPPLAATVSGPGVPTQLPAKESAVAI
ncbi:hypothetical protein GGX14DRAFT_625869 [Mycena pura]|uniref:SUZ domain-containing protein n=1 Tax=Mycena pura TaxID=153505 RepID=A0AAD6VIE6_9AGAR|nr:hypothetical protein GGX14DRAFT_625869 [Mycena pura]